MTSLSVKEYLSLKMPTEEAPVSDQSRIQLALDALGYEHVTIPLHILRILYPMCRDANFDITVTLVHREYDWVVTHVEPGDQRHHHYGLAVDYGSTTILMQLIDLNTGSIIAEEKVVNGQVAYAGLRNEYYRTCRPDKRRLHLYWLGQGNSHDHACREYNA